MFTHCLRRFHLVSRAALGASSPGAGFLLLPALLAAAGLLAGCAGDSGEGPEETTSITVALGASQVRIEEEVTVTAGYVGSQGGSPECHWYVNGVLGGNPMVGTITQDNPATYAAPSAVPAGGEVEIRAAWRADTTVVAADSLVVTGPSALSLTFESSSVRIEEEVQITAALLFARGVPEYDWYVNGVLGGGEDVGTITQANPATYTAPATVPPAGKVAIKAAWRGDTTVAAADSLEINGPTGVCLTAPQAEVQVTGEVELTAELLFARGAAEFNWYVDDVLGGNEELGTITQTNPATYTAPAALPPTGQVEIKAAWQGDQGVFSTASLTILFTTKYVDAQNGEDGSDRGGAALPLKTITYALGIVSPGDTIHVFPGTYDKALGEGDCFYLMSGVTLRGADRDACLLYGGPGFYPVTIGEGATIEHFTVGNTGGLADIGIYSADTGTIRDILVHDSFYYSAIRITSSSGAVVVESCEIINTSDPGTGRGFELTSGSHATVRNCTVSGWYYGIFVNLSSDPLIEGCTITGDTIGVSVFSAESNPDLGGGARGSAGGNTIQENVQYGIFNRATGAIPALYNTWNQYPPVVSATPPSDIYNEAGGSVIWGIGGIR